MARRRRQTLGAQVVGLRHFNVYGPREGHKGRMASVNHHFFHQYRAEGRVKPEVGKILDVFTPHECSNYFAPCGYVNK